MYDVGFANVEVTVRSLSVLSRLAPGGALVLAMLAGCGGGVAGGTGNTPPPQQAAIDHRIAGEAVVKVRSAGTGWVAMAEKLQPSFVPIVRPERRLLIADGATPGASWAPPAGWSLIDFAVHPGRDISVVIATDSSIRLLRLDPRGAVRTATDFSDALIPNDPFTSDPLVIPDHAALLPRVTRDAVRIAAAGEELVLALHPGRNAILAYRFAHGGAGYARAWRTLVEPGVFVGGRATTSGSFDPYDGLAGQWQVLLDVDAAGRVAVGVNLYPSEYAEGHAMVFKEALPAEFYLGALVTQLAPDGRRVGTSYLDTRVNTEIKALRWHGDNVVAVGRVLPERAPDGSGWDGLVGIIPAGHTGKAAWRTVDVERGDVLLDAAPLSGGRLLVAGSTGYIQNPAGASISEEAKPLLAILATDGSLAQRLDTAAGPRHNQVRSLAQSGSGWIAAGLDNGPGTHTADADPALLRADGWVRTVRLP
jgi:hypothetical protein